MSAIISLVRNSRVVATAAAALVLTCCIAIYTISILLAKRPVLEEDNTPIRAVVEEKSPLKKEIQFGCFNFIKIDNTETVVRAFITKKGFAVIPLVYFNNIKEIVWKEDGREILIDSGLSWYFESPLVLLKIPYENREGSLKIVRWTPNKPVHWQSDNSTLSELVIKPNISMASENYFREIEIQGDTGNGLLLQDAKIVGWTFSCLKNKGYLWAGLDEEEIKPNLDLNTLEVLLNNKLQIALEKGSLSDRKNFLIIRSLSLFLLENKPNRNWDSLIIELISRVCSRGITGKKYHEVLSIVTSSLLLRSQSVSLLECYTEANRSIYGDELAISLLEKLGREEGITTTFYSNIILLVAKAYNQWIQELLYYEKYNDAINIYNRAILKFPDDQELKLAGIEAYIKLNDYQRAQELLSSTLFDSKYVTRLRELKRIIANLKASADKIIIKFSPNAQKNIFVDSLINQEFSQRFILDTGASIVSIPLSMARKLGIDLVDGNYADRTIATASGIFKTKEVMLSSLTINGKCVPNVSAIIIDLPQDKNLGLLGMNFLSRFHMELNNEKSEIVLTPKSF